MEESSEAQIIYRQGFTVGIKSAQDIRMEGVGAVGIAAGGDMHLADSVGVAVKARGDMSMTDSAAVSMKVGGNTAMQESAAVLMRANDVTASRSFVGVLLARQATIDDGSRVVLNTWQAAALGAAFGAAFALLRWLLERKSRKGGTAWASGSKANASLGGVSRPADRRGARKLVCSCCS